MESGSPFGLFDVVGLCFMYFSHERTVYLRNDFCNVACAISFFLSRHRHFLRFIQDQSFTHHDLDQKEDHDVKIDAGNFREVQRGR